MNTFSAMAVAGTFGIATVASGNILLNGGFEAGSGTSADNWNAVVGGPSGFVERSSAMPNSGNFSAHMSFDHINNPVAGGAYFFEQVQPVGSIVGGDDYTISFSAKSESTNFIGMDAFVQILWLDQDDSNGGGVQGEQLISLIPLGLNDSYQQFSFDVTSAANADSFLLRFQVSAGAVAGIANGMFVDDASLTPTPASAALLGLSGLVAARRRR